MENREPSPGSGGIVVPECVYVDLSPELPALMCQLSSTSTEERCPKRTLVEAEDDKNIVPESRQGTKEGAREEFTVPNALSYPMRSPARSDKQNGNSAQLVFAHGFQRDQIVHIAPANRDPVQLTYKNKTQDDAGSVVVRCAHFLGQQTGIEPSKTPQKVPGTTLIREGAEADWDKRRYLAKAKVWVLSEDYVRHSGVLQTKSHKDKGLFQPFYRTRSAEDTSGPVPMAPPSAYQDDEPPHHAPGQGGPLARRRRGAIFEAEVHKFLSGSGRKAVGLALDGAGTLRTCTLHGDFVLEQELCDISRIESCERLHLQAPDTHVLVVRYASTSAQTTGQMCAARTKIATFAFATREECNEWLSRLKPSREKKSIEMFAKVCSLFFLAPGTEDPRNIACSSG